jgi:hypothetical protein
LADRRARAVERGYICVVFLKQKVKYAFSLPVLKEYTPVQKLAEVYRSLFE